MASVCDIVLKATVKELCKAEDFAYNFGLIQDVIDAVCDLQNDQTRIRESIGGSLNVCIGDTVNLFVEIPSEYLGVTYSWTGPNGFTDSVKEPSFVASAASEGKYTVTVSVPGFDPFTASVYVQVECCASCYVNTVETPVSKPTSPCEGDLYIDLVNSTVETYCGGTWIEHPAALMDDPAYVTGEPIVCDGDDISLFAFGGVSFAWTGPNSFGSALQNPTVVGATSINEGNYECVITRADGSLATDGVYVKVVNCPAPIAIVDIDC